MEKINFYQPKNQFSRAEIKFLLKRLLPLNFKIFSRALNKTQCVKSVQIRSFLWSVFSRIRTIYGEILRISLYSVRMRENTDQEKLCIWTLFKQWQYCFYQREKSFPLAGMKNLLKKRFLQEKLPGISDKQKSGFSVARKNSFYQEQWSFSVKIGCCIISVMFTTSKKNTIILKNTISL